MKDIRFCQITKVENVLKNDKKEFHETENPIKAYKLTINTGTEERLVISAIVPWFRPEDLLDKVTTFQLDLPPREIRGYMSTAMIHMPLDENPTLIEGGSIGESFWAPPTLEEAAEYLEQKYQYMSDTDSLLIMQLIDHYKLSKEPKKGCQCC